MLTLGLYSSFLFMKPIHRDLGPFRENRYYGILRLIQDLVQKLCFVILKGAQNMIANTVSRLGTANTDENPPWPS